ncbi:MAG: glutaminyl-peptide cyclotransferase [Gammaproteobacteria bacterium]|nr:glutaminyl-peptide cyclotransferase [Gammaproteobacteria bacterium]
MWAVVLAAAIAAGEAPAPAEYGYRVVQSYPHDPGAFTQGLLFHGGRLFESTGGYGFSTVREVELETGRVLRERRLGDAIFGEGLALVGERLVQLTWREGVGFVYDAGTLRSLDQFTYAGEGWGLASDDGRLVMSDGTATLRFLDPATFRESHRVTVNGPEGPVAGLNELEFVGDALYANVYQTESIAIIDPADGSLRGWLRLDGILPVVLRREDTAEMNGIAYDPATGRLFVTGKRWPRLFEIEVVPRPPG